MRTAPWRPPRPTAEPPTVLINERQAQVLDGLFHGMSTAEIADSLFLSQSTVKAHAKRLYRLMGAKGAANAVGLATSGQVCVLVRVDAWKAPKVRAS